MVTGERALALGMVQLDAHVRPVGEPHPRGEAKCIAQAEDTPSSTIEKCTERRAAVLTSALLSGRRTTERTTSGRGWTERGTIGSSAGFQATGHDLGPISAATLLADNEENLTFVSADGTLRRFTMEDDAVYTHNTGWPKLHMDRNYNRLTGNYLGRSLSDEVSATDDGCGSHAQDVGPPHNEHQYDVRNDDQHERGEDQHDHGEVDDHARYFDSWKPHDDDGWKLRTHDDESRHRPHPQTSETPQGWWRKTGVGSGYLG
eukprot:Polyplicarium_translucidae@DN3384_c2_g1_i10.p1